MKRLIIISILGVLFLSTAFSSVKAYNFNTDSGIANTGSKAGFNVNASTSPEYYVGMILTLLFSLVGLVFLILTIYAGINWMTAQGNSSQVEKAKDTLIHSIVGLVIVMAAYGITVFVMNTFAQKRDQTLIDSPVNTTPADPNNPANIYSA